MIRLLKQRAASPNPVPPLALDPLEIAVMEILWARHESSVHDVVQRLDRRKADRAFLYSPRLSRREWEQERAGEFVAGFLARPQPSGELLISCLVEAVGEQDETRGA